MGQSEKELSPWELSDLHIAEQLEAHEMSTKGTAEASESTDNRPSDPFIVYPRHNPEYIRNNVRWFNGDQTWRGER